MARKETAPKRGSYFDVSTWEFVYLTGEEPLPETSGLKKVPGALMLLFAPVIGFFYVIFLPLTAIVAAVASPVIKIKRLSLAKSKARQTSPVVK